MKKNISINISGIIFHIEEDGYEILKKYLDSINKYFSAFEDSSEILPDIESRIAEIFLSKLNEGKQVITPDDVNSLMTTMGSVRDFQAAEEQEVGQSETSERSQKQSSSSSRSSQSSYSAPKTMMRDQKRKILGGVCAGLANYWNIDTVWVRLLFALFTFLYGFALLAYVILWIVLPGSYELDEPQVSRKLFRDSERKALGGVAGGLAAYFDLEIIVVRLLFVIFTFFGGLGLVAYIVLWIVLPEARSLTDKMQMQGEPVTLSNIETTIKKNLDIKEDEEESALVKILLFPFRAIAFILSGLGKILTPLAELLRVAIGIFITLIGLTFFFSTLLGAGILFGMFSFSSGWILGWEEIGLPLEAIARAIPPFTGFIALIGSLIPGIIIALLGISIIAKRIVFNAAVGWSLFILFFISFVVMSVSIPKIIYGFKEEGEHKVEQVYDLQGKTPVLKLRETGMDDYDAASLSLKGYDGKEIKLVQYFEAQGSTRQQAAENAQMVTYSVNLRDSILTFDSNVKFKEDAIFRAQRLKMTLYIPNNQRFVLDEQIWRLLSHYIDYDKRQQNTWMFTERGLKCQTCPKEVVSSESGEKVINEFGLNDFSELTINGFMDVHIYRGDEYAVELEGNSDERRKYTVFKQGDKLIVEYDNKRKFTWHNSFDFDRMRINIVMPKLEKIEINGAGNVTIENFEERDLEIEANGAVKIKADVDARNLTVDLNGASQLELRGKGTLLEASLAGASTLRAFNYEVEDATIETIAACRAYVNVTNHLNMRKGFGSKIDYRGNPERITRDY